MVATRNLLSVELPTDVFDLVCQRVEESLAQLGSDEFPNYTVGKGWDTSPVEGWLTSLGNWTAGFWPGVLWRVYQMTGEARFREEASRWTRQLAPRRTCTAIHDVGFLFYPSAGLGYDLTGDPELRSWALTAAQSLTRRSDPRHGFITISGEVADIGSVAIDTMMNLPLLWWAAERGAGDTYHNVAVWHARWAAQHLVRPDGSTQHVVEVDMRTGAVQRRFTLQGVSAESCWSRGQAWALTGFAFAYRVTGDGEFLGTARRVADYWVARVSDDLVPYWDFDAPVEQGTSRDSSAAAIAANGLLMLGQLEPVPQRAIRYEQVAQATLESLSTGYLNRDGRAGPAVLAHGTYHLPASRGVDAGLICGDYFFLTALVELAARGRRTGGAYSK